MNVPYNQNPELSTMKDDLSSRELRLKLKKAAIIGVTALAGFAVGAFFLPSLLTAGLVGAMVGVALGDKIADVMTLKDAAKLQIDNQMVQSYMSGKNYWGEGFREEVLEHGYGGAVVPPLSPNVPARADAKQIS